MLQKWGVSQTMVVETLTKESLGTWLEKGIGNVAFLSLALGLENTASAAFIEAKVLGHQICWSLLTGVPLQRCYVPPADEAEEEEEEKEEEEEDEDSSNDCSLR